MLKTLKSAVRPSDGPRRLSRCLPLLGYSVVAQAIRPCWRVLMACCVIAVYIMAVDHVCGVQCCTLFSDKG